MVGFAHAFLILQFLFVGIVTSASIAGIIAEEKERGTLAALLVTDLSGREIVLGKLVPRVAHLLLILLASLPIAAALCATYMHPLVALAVFAAAALTVVSLAGVSILCSVYARKPRDAIFFAYALVILYMDPSLVCNDYLGLLQPSLTGLASSGLAADVVGWCSAGDPLVQS